MKIRVIKPCVIGGKSVKPSNKHHEVDAKEGRMLVAFGKAVDLEPKTETVELELSVDPKELEAVKKEIASLKEQLEAKDTEIASLKEQLEGKGA